MVHYKAQCVAAGQVIAVKSGVEYTRLVVVGCRVLMHVLNVGMPSTHIKTDGARAFVAAHL